MVIAKIKADKLNLTNKTSDPSGAEGELYYNSTDKKMKYYNGSGWEDMGGGSIPSFNSGNYTIVQFRGDDNTSGAQQLNTTMLWDGEYIQCIGGEGSDDFLRGGTADTDSRFTWSAPNGQASSSLTWRALNNSASNSAPNGIWYHGYITGTHDYLTDHTGDFSVFFPEVYAYVNPGSNRAWSESYVRFGGISLVSYGQSNSNMSTTYQNIEMKVLRSTNRLEYWRGGVYQTYVTLPANIYIETMSGAYVQPNCSGCGASGGSRLNWLYTVGTGGDYTKRFESEAISEYYVPAGTSQTSKNTTFSPTVTSITPVITGLVGDAQTNCTVEFSTDGTTWSTPINPGETYTFPSATATIYVAVNMHNYNGGTSTLDNIMCFLERSA